MDIRCIAIDDSPLALNILEDYIQRVGYLKLVKRCTSRREAIKVLQKENIDLIFLEIHMPGSDLLKGLKVKPAIIITTAYPKYAIEGFNMNVADYLLKPFTFDRFKMAIEKVLRFQQVNTKPFNQQEYIFIKSGYEIVKVGMEEIVYIKALKDYIQIFTKSKKILVLMPMKNIIRLLPKEKFIRTHRSYIVPFDKITKIAAKKVFIEKREIPVGESYRTEVFRTLKKKFILG